MTERTAKILRSTEVVLLLAGIGGLAFVGAASLYSMFFQLRVERELDRVGNSEPVRSRSNEWHEFPPSPLGRLEIPAVDLNVIVLQGVDPWTLTSAVAHIPGTALPGEQGNIGIAGQQYTFFRALQDIALSDQIILRTRQSIHYYTVESIEVVTPEDASVLRNSPDPNLTLVTCNPFYFASKAQQRFIVRAHEVTMPPGF
jgi:LPXTG-site transpeptidase (sortase) family protein